MSVNFSDSAVAQVCKFFSNFGLCKFGSHCRYLHSYPEKKSTSENPGCNSEQKQSSPPNEVALDDTVRSINTAKTQKEKKTCKFYSSSGSCRFGKQCRYKHVINQDPESLPLCKLEEHFSNEDREPLKEASLTENEVLKTEPSVSIRDDPKVKKTRCKYVKSGRCHFGDRCRFWHPKNYLNSATNDVDETSSSSPKKPYESVGKVVANSRTSSVQSRKPVSNYILADLQKEDLQRLKNIEVTQLKKRFPKAAQADSGSEKYVAYSFVFTPTDPDWPYDVKELPMEVFFPQNYPKKKLKIHLPAIDDLPDALRGCIGHHISAWLEERYNSLLGNGKVELVFRPFLKWLDKALEDLFTDGLKQYKRELVAKAAGFEFIPATSLIRNTASSDEDSDEEAKEERIKQGASPTDSDEEANGGYEVAHDTESDVSHNGIKQESSATESADPDVTKNEPNATIQNNFTKQNIIDPIKKGTELKLKNLQLEGAGTLLASKIMIIIQCSRCKNKTEVTTLSNQVNSVNCLRCFSNQLIVFRAALVHQFSAVIGYLDLQGCIVFDLVISECLFLIGCINCAKEMKLEGFMAGQVKDIWCQHCHQKMRVATEGTRLQQLQPSEITGVHTVIIKTQKKAPKDPAIQEGRPLPDTGTCKHYKKSFRWLRFPCCGKAYPCDVCHDEHEIDHDMKFANRMICGFCAKEQHYAGDKPCVACSSFLTKKATTHWEGGKGCRDKISMSRSDERKYSNMNKTVSRKAKEKTAPKKKTTVLRHA